MSEQTSDDPLLERVAKALYIADHKRRGLTDIVRSWDEQWERAKELLAQDPETYTVPADAYANARTAIDIIRPEIMKLQHDLDEAVGYKLAAAEGTTGDRDRDDV